MASAAGPRSRHSTAPPLGTRRPSRRAGNTRVLLTTSRSPAPSTDDRSATTRDSGCRSRDRARAAATSPRGGACCAISSSGQMEIEVGDFHGRGSTQCTAVQSPRSNTVIDVEQEQNHVSSRRRIDREAELPVAITPANGLTPVAIEPVSVTLALTVLAVLAVVLVLQYAQAVLIPVVIGILISYGLEPFVGGAAARCACRRSIGAAVVGHDALRRLGLGGLHADRRRRWRSCRTCRGPRSVSGIASARIDGSTASAIGQVQEAAKEIEKTAHEANAPTAAERQTERAVQDPPASRKWRSSSRRSSHRISLGRRHEPASASPDSSRWSCFWSTSSS